MKETVCAAGKGFEVEIALREALANSVVHGCGNDLAKVVEFELSCRDAELEIVARDPGPSFDPLPIPNPVAEENLCSIHGRGIYLIRQLVDDVWFGRAGSRSHIVHVAQRAAGHRLFPDPRRSRVRGGRAGRALRRS